MQYNTLVISQDHLSVCLYERYGFENGKRWEVGANPSRSRGSYVARYSIEI